MVNRRTAYELSAAQVVTPDAVVSLFWRLAHRYRTHFGTVLDMGAGDCRFAKHGTFQHYTGIEIDKQRVAIAAPPDNGEVIRDCVFRHKKGDYDACIGNPPYVRHHDVESPWMERTVARLERDLGIALNKNGNLYLYFLCLGLLKTRADGLVALVIPYEWVSRPSAAPIRKYIIEKQWNVTVYRFQMPVFDGVLTTASISIVDKAQRDGRWQYYDIDESHHVYLRLGPADSKAGVLEYAPRGKIWALRGLSPGSQKIFTLTDGERIHNGLSKHDVVPCVTTLRHVPRSLTNLTPRTFEKYFVKTGEKCWLIRSNEDRVSQALNAYLESVPSEERQTYTCTTRTPWFKYAPHPVSQILVSSGFTEFGPKVMINSVGARAVGSVFGVHADARLPLRRLQTYLLGVDFEKQVVAHAKSLKKVEVRQLNAVLNKFVEQERNNGRAASR